MDLRRELLTDAIPFPLKEEVVKAILEGKELKVAQVIELPHDFNTENINIINARQGGIFDVQFECFDTDESIFIKPKYKVGDALWVEESAKITDYSFPSMDEILDGDARPKDWLMWYKLFDSEKDIEMVIPFFLRVTDARVENLQDISEEDCLKEGVKEILCACGGHCGNEPCPMAYNISHKEHFMKLWDSVAKDGYKWKDNRLITVNEFELIALKD